MNHLIGKAVRAGYNQFEKWRKYANSRKQAMVWRKEVVRRKKRAFVDNKLIAEIKTYAKREFGSSGYWPWLALYAEVREDFLQGWIPNDYYCFEMIPKLNPRSVAMVSTIKSLDHVLFDGFAIQPLGMRISGRFFDHQKNRLADSDFLKLLEDFNSEVVIKRDGAPSGKGIVFKHSGDVRQADFKSQYNYMVHPSVKQYPALNELYPDSVNTVRIATFLENDGTVSLKFILLRFGMGGNRIDNVGSGGRFVYLDREGNVTSNAYDSLGLDTGSRHPDTGFLYKKLRVPSVIEAVELCRRSHLLIPYVRFIAWDVCIDRDSTPRLIEWNAKCPDIWTDEALIGPLWPECPA